MELILLLRLMIIDKNMNAVEVEVNESLFRLLNVDFSKVVKHEKKRDLNITITEYLDSFKEEE